MSQRSDIPPGHTLVETLWLRRLEQCYYGTGPSHQQLEKDRELRKMENAIKRANAATPKAPEEVQQEQLLETLRQMRNIPSDAVPFGAASRYEKAIAGDPETDAEDKAEAEDEAEAEDGVEEEEASR